ncbi:MAG: sulfate ABC transporter permease subunit CysT [Lachnospiraceae bacterium]|nr:sulfate ABC transporter permease subunit CysT [Lachnospiraceae bacterium]
MKGFRLTFGITVFMSSLLVFIPLASVLVYGLRLSPIKFWELVSADNVRNAFVTSVVCSFAAAMINCFFGVILAWTLVRYDFKFKILLDGLIELPFALPTAVAGITLSKMYGNTGFPGKLLSKAGINVSYTHLGIIVALVFVGIPFVVRTVQPVLEKLDRQYEEAAFVLGAGSVTTFRRIILPEIMPAVLTGFGLAFARGVGEYGSVIYISGNSAKEKTQVVSYVIMQKLNYMDYEGATAVALLMLIISFLVLLFVNAMQIRQSRHTNEL